MRCSPAMPASRSRSLPSRLFSTKAADIWNGGRGWKKRLASVGSKYPDSTQCRAGGIVRGHSATLPKSCWGRRRVTPRRCEPGPGSPTGPPAGPGSGGPRPVGELRARGRRGGLPFGREGGGGTGPALPGWPWRGVRSRSVSPALAWTSVACSRPLLNCSERSSAMGVILSAGWPSRGPRHADREVARRPALLTCLLHVRRGGARHEFHQPR